MKKFTTKPRVFRTSPGYAGTPAFETKDWVYLGRLAEAGPLTDVRFDTDMAHVVALFGKRGSGKSYTLGTLLEGLCTRHTESSIAANPRHSALLLFDTLGVFSMDEHPAEGGCPEGCPPGAVRRPPRLVDQTGAARRGHLDSQGNPHAGNTSGSPGVCHQLL